MSVTRQHLVLIHNACNIANEGSKSNKDRQTVFYEIEDGVEPTGGIFWTWKVMRKRSIYNEEGFRFSARLVAANAMQFFIIICKYYALLVLSSFQLELIN